VLVAELFAMKEDHALGNRNCSFELALIVEFDHLLAKFVSGLTRVQLRRLAEMRAMNQDGQDDWCYSSHIKLLKADPPWSPRLTREL
jgi:hypothetical protein